MDEEEDLFCWTHGDNAAIVPVIEGSLNMIP